MKKSFAKGICSALALAMFTFMPIATSIEAKQKIVQVQKMEKKNLKQTIDEILKPYTKKLNTGIEVVSLKDGKDLYQRNEDKQFMPASTVKLITAMVALKELGPNYKFKTEFYTKGEIKDGVIDGDLYVKGYGNPYMVSEQLWFIAKELHKKGIKEINGNIIADDSYFDSKKHSPGWYEETSRDDRSKAYSAPNGALSFNFNTIEVHVKSGEKALDEPIITLDPEVKYLEVINQAQTYPRYNNIEVLREKREGKDVIVIYGGIKLGKEKVSRVNVSEPAEYFMTVFKEFLKKEGVSVKGFLEKGFVTEQAELIFTHESKPLSSIIKDLCKYSNNFVADQIVKTLDAELNQKQGSLEGGVEILKNYLDRLGLKGHELVDGSGYSIKNKLTPNQVIKILEEAYSDFEIFPEFIAAQSIAGLDGSLQDRLNAISGEARAKTGTLGDTGVSNLSGYVKTKDNDVLAFSILMQSRDLKIWQMRDLQDEIIEKLADYSTKK